MADGVGRILAKPGFDPTNFVKKVAEQGEDELLRMRKNVAKIQEDTAVALKKNVFKNYSQFIETAKEISILEGEMYHLSHMLTDQRSIITSMLDMSMTEQRTNHSPGQVIKNGQVIDASNALATILEKVEGCSLLTEVPNRALIYESDLKEIDPESFLETAQMHAFLLTDMLMLTSLLSSRRGPVKYKMQRLYELDALAIVNVRDVGPCRNVFKILMFPDARMFQAENARVKREWLELIEETKKRKTTLDNQTQSLKSEELDGTAAHCTNNDTLLQEEWLQEMPEDLDVSIAQRNFEAAVDLIEKVNDNLASLPRSPSLKEYQIRIQQRVKLLTEVLMKELQLAPERSISGGPRAVNRAVTQLIRLGKSIQACHLFLKNRSALIDYNIKQLKIEGATYLYIRKLSQLFFENVMETGQEFLNSFPDQDGCFSVFLVWAKEEVNNFGKIFLNQVFNSKATLASTTDCVDKARYSCKQLQKIGLDVLFVFDSCLHNDVARVVRNYQNSQEDSVKQRIKQEQWKPTNYLNAESLRKAMEEMESLGLKGLQTFQLEKFVTVLSTFSIQFARSFLPYCENICKLYSFELHCHISNAIIQPLQKAIYQAKAALQQPQFSAQSHIITKNIEFLSTALIDATKVHFESRAKICLDIPPSLKA